MFTAKLSVEKSLQVENQPWNESLRLMYRFIDKNLESEDEKVQESIKKIASIASRTCYQYIDDSYQNLFVPIPHNNRTTVLLAYLEYPKDDRESIVLVDVSQDLALLKRV